MLGQLTKGVGDVVKTFEDTIQNLNDNIEAEKYIKKFKNENLKNETACHFIPGMCRLYKTGNLNEDVKQQLFKSIESKFNSFGKLSQKVKEELFESINSKSKSLDEESKKLINQMIEKAREEAIVLSTQPPLTKTYLPQELPNTPSSPSSAGSDSSRGSGYSGASIFSVGSLIETLRQLVGSNKSYSTEKGLEPQEEKKGPTKSPPSCSAGIKNAFSSCCSCLYNGLRNSFKSEFDRFMDRQIEREKQEQMRRRREEKAELEEWLRHGYTLKKKVKREPQPQPQPQPASPTYAPPHQSTGSGINYQYGEWTRNKNGKWIYVYGGDGRVTSDDVIGGLSWAARASARAAGTFLGGVASVIGTTAGLGLGAVKFGASINRQDLTPGDNAKSVAMFLAGACSALVCAPLKAVVAGVKGVGRVNSIVYNSSEPRRDQDPFIFPNGYRPTQTTWAERVGKTAGGAAIGAVKFSRFIWNGLPSRPRMPESFSVAFPTR